MLSLKKTRCWAVVCPTNGCAKVITLVITCKFFALYFCLSRKFCLILCNNKNRYQ